VIYEGRTLVARAARSALEAGGNPVIVVLGANAELVRAALTGIEPVTIVVNSDWETGLASSLNAGLTEAKRTGADAALIALADQPRVNAESLVALITQFNRGNRVVAASYSGVIGVPVIIGREHFDELLQLQGDVGAGQWLRAHRSEVTEVPLVAAAGDLDTPADAQRLQRESFLHPDGA
jgi:CTP:molybdopterin cytidylyltransferase MocA